jgi:hypothetical protein
MRYAAPEMPKTGPRERKQVIGQPASLNERAHKDKKRNYGKSIAGHGVEELLPNDSFGRAKPPVDCKSTETDQQQGSD